MIVVTQRRILKSAARGTAPARRLLAWLLDRELPMNQSERTGVLEWLLDAIARAERGEVPTSSDY